MEPQQQPSSPPPPSQPVPPRPPSLPPSPQGFINYREPVVPPVASPVPAAAPKPASAVTPPPPPVPKPPLPEVAAAPKPKPFVPPVPLVPTPQFKGMPGHSAPDNLPTAPAPEVPVIPKTPIPPPVMMRGPAFAPAPAPVPTPVSMPEPMKQPMMTATPVMSSRPVPPPMAPRQFTGSEPPLPPLSRPGLAISTLPARRHHGARWLGAFLIILTLLAAGAYAAYAFVLNPASALPKSVDALDAAPMLHGEMLLTVDSDNRQIAGSSISFAADVDRTAPGLPARQLSIDLESPTVSLAGQIRLINSTIYAELTRVPTQYAAKYASVTDHWYSVTLDTLKTASASYGSSPEIMKNPPSLRQSFDVLAGTGILGMPSFAGFGFVDGKPVRQYVATIDRDALSNFIASFARAGGASSTTLSQATVAAKAMLATLSMSPVTISTDLLSGALRGVRGDLTVNMPSSQYVSSSNLTVHFSLTFDPSQNVSVSVPPGAIAEDAAITGAFGQTQTLDKNAKIQADIAQIRTAMEMYHQTSYAGGCTKSATVQALVSDLKSMSGMALCRDSSRAYLVAAPLLTTPSNGTASYYCADSTGKMTTLAKLPSGYVCK